MPELAEVKGLPAEDLSLPSVFITRPLYFVIFSIVLIFSLIRNVDLISCSILSSH